MNEVDGDLDIRFGLVIFFLGDPVDAREQFHTKGRLKAIDQLCNPRQPFPSFRSLLQKLLRPLDCGRKYNYRSIASTVSVATDEVPFHPLHHMV